jgi:dihydroflavonol-4-reductase
MLVNSMLKKMRLQSSSNSYVAGNTGATGHVGNVLVRKLLERGEKVRALILPGECRESISGLRVEAVEGDVLNLDSLYQIHARGERHLPSCGRHFDHAGSQSAGPSVNVEGTKMS